MAIVTQTGGEVPTEGSLMGHETHGGSALVQNGIGGIVVQQPCHGESLLLTPTQGLAPVLDCVPPLAPGKTSAN